MAAGAIAQGRVTGLLRGHPFCDFLLNQSFQVEAEFFRKLLLDRVLAEQRTKSKRQLVYSARKKFSVVSRQFSDLNP